MQGQDPAGLWLGSTVSAPSWICDGGSWHRLRKGRRSSLFHLHTEKQSPVERGVPTGQPGAALYKLIAAPPSLPGLFSCK